MYRVLGEIYWYQILYTLCISATNTWYIRIYVHADV